MPSSSQQFLQSTAANWWPSGLQTGTYGILQPNGPDDSAVPDCPFVVALGHNSYWLAMAENRQPLTSAADHLSSLITWMNEEEAAQPAAGGVHRQLSIRPPTTTPTTSVAADSKKIISFYPFLLLHYE
ncbi:hypothetical protein T02_332 [Trichinella nativa]|uniref:Uncharacterized protein n=1 Tax=Trichinella nativa TaxID=6335 RepID=A0A0V1L0V7_9BILA|nr:hypothetical protein T02_332 [Trichinella nativa]